LRLLFKLRCSRSPILEEQDKWDIAKNILIGGALGGVVGGGLEAARTLSTIKKARLQEDLLSKHLTLVKLFKKLRLLLIESFLQLRIVNHCTPLLTLTGDAAEDAVRKLNMLML
jgi:hypothetical protein